MNILKIRADINSPWQSIVAIKGDTGPQGSKGETGDGVPAVSSDDDGKVLGIVNGETEWINGTAYAAAQAGGYSGTEANFYADLAALDGLASQLAQL